MTHTDASPATKQLFASSLSKYMALKPLSKITISELCDDCGMNRKTFYYHFQDIYDLLKWMLEREATIIASKYDLLVDYKEVIGLVIDYVDENNHLLNCAFDAMGREGMKRFFFADFQGAMTTVVEGIETFMRVTLDSEFKQFLCDFYTYALAGMLIDWFLNRNVRSKEEMIEYISITIKSSLPNVISAHTGVPFHETLY